MPRSCFVTPLRVALTSATLSACLIAPLVAQSGGGAVERSPIEADAMTIVARYDVEPTALQSATSASELADALREHLVGDFAMPLDEPLQVDLYGGVNDPVHGGEYFFGFSALGVLVDGRESVAGPLSAVIREAHGPGSGFDDDEWDEASAWQDLRDAIRSGLTESLAALNTDFEADSEGRIPLRVAAVHVIPTEEYEFQEGLERLFVRIDPAPRFGSSAMADWEPPENLDYATQSVLIELEPVAVESDEPEIEAVDLSVEELDRLAGDYENPQLGGVTISRVEGELYAQPDEPGEEAIALVPTSPTEFVAPDQGNLAFVFEIGADGVAVAVTVSQDGQSFEFAKAGQSPDHVHDIDRPTTSRPRAVLATGDNTRSIG